MWKERKTYNIFVCQVFSLDKQGGLLYNDRALGVSDMKQEAFKMSLLLDYYGALLTEKQKTYFDLYYNQDLSLSEIAEQEGISRQGVHDAISRTEAILSDMEQATGCVARAQSLRTAEQEIASAARELLQHEDPTVRENAARILTAVSSVKE